MESLKATAAFSLPSGSLSPYAMHSVLTSGINEWRRRLFSRRPPRSRRRGIVPVARRARYPAFHDVLDLFFVDGLVLDQGLRHGLQFVHIGLQDFVGALIVAVDHPAHFFVDHVRRDVRHLLVLSDAAAQKYFARLLAVGLRTETVGQAPARHHV